MLFIKYRNQFPKICVPDQIGTLSQVETKKISKGGWTIFERFEPHRNHYLSFHSQSDPERVFTLGRNWFSSSRRLYKTFWKRNSFNNLCKVNGKVPDLKRHHPTQSE